MKIEQHVVRITLLLIVATLLATTGCGPGNVIAKRPTIDDVDDQTATCKVAKYSPSTASAVSTSVVEASVAGV